MIEITNSFVILMWIVPCPACGAGSDALTGRWCQETQTAANAARRRQEIRGAAAGGGRPEIAFPAAGARQEKRAGTRWGR